MIPDDQIPLYAGLGLAVGTVAYYLAAVLVDAAARVWRRAQRRRRHTDARFNGRDGGDL
jgi:hypothetical protein